MKTFIVHIACHPLQRTALLALLLGLVLAACSQNTRPAADLTPEQQVAQRAEQRWQLIMQGDFLAAYEYLTPGYRSRVTERAYANRLATSNIEYMGVNVAAVNCEDEQPRCEAQTDVEFAVRGLLRGVERMESESRISEIWLQDSQDGNWYYFPES